MKGDPPSGPPFFFHSLSDILLLRPFYIAIKKPGS